MPDLVSLRLPCVRDFEIEVADDEGPSAGDRIPEEINLEAIEALPIDAAGRPALLAFARRPADVIRPVLAGRRIWSIR